MTEQEQIKDDPIFILTVGEFRNENRMVTTDVKAVASMYAEIVENGDFRYTTHTPYVEIWVDGELKEVFHEPERDKEKLWKHLSKKARTLS